MSSQKRWFVKSSLERTVVEKFRSTLKVDSVVAELLLQREIASFEEAEQFFRPKWSQLHDPFLMRDMTKACDRLMQAIDQLEHVRLYGDYDVDGTTSVALMFTFLKDRVEQLSYYIPDRYAEGYGVSEQGIDAAINEGVQLLITLDCGIKATEQIARARAAGIDVIVCDHHEPGDEIPDAIVLDPKRKDCKYPYKELSGCGVGFKLLQAMVEKQGSSRVELVELMDFLAISIGADIVDVTGENRVLCALGMKQLNEQPRLAFREILTLANRSFPLSLTDVVFSIAPRINAAGRLRSGGFAVELMISDNLNEIQSLAAEINEDNSQRKELDATITEEALEMLSTESEDRVTNVVHKDGWHKGVVGIVASRVIETYYKPTIVLTGSNGLVTGSARSVKHFDVYSAIDACGHLLEKYGGHKYAAGLTMKKENVTEFKRAFEAEVQKRIPKELLVEEVTVDMELDFDQIFGSEENRLKIPRLKRILNQFEPHGPGNMKPVFLSKNVYATDIRLLKDAHLKMSMVQPEGDVVLEGIGFFLGHKIDDVASGIPFDLVYTLEVNRWRDRETLQLNIKDIRESI